MTFKESVSAGWGRFSGLSVKVRVIIVIGLTFLLLWAFSGLRSCSEAGRDEESREAHQEWVKGDWDLQSQVNILRGQMEEVKQSQAEKDAEHARDIAALTQALSDATAANERSSSTRRNYRNVKSGRNVPNVDKLVPNSELRDVLQNPGP